MKTFEECKNKLVAYASAYNLGAKDPDAFFDAMEAILISCREIKENHSNRAEDVADLMNDPSEQVRRIGAFCLLEYLECSPENEAKAMKVIVDFLNGSYGAQHIVWLTWLEALEKRTGKKSGYTLRAELSPLTENYAGKWLKLARENQKAEFLSETPAYPFDSFEFVSDDGDDDGDDEFPF